MLTLNFQLHQDWVGNDLWFLARVRFYLLLDPPSWTMLAETASMDEVLHDLYLRFKEYCREKKIYCSVSRFSLKTIHREKSTSTPKYVCKAAKSNVLVAWLADLTNTFAQRCPEALKQEALQVAACTWGLAQYFYLLKTSGARLSDEQAASLDLCSQMFLCMYSARARDSRGPNVNCWHHIPKMHQFHHLVLDAIADRQNPSAFQCFTGEDMVGKLIKTAATAHPFSVVLTTVQRYLLLLQETWTDLYLT